MARMLAGLADRLAVVGLRVDLDDPLAPLLVPDPHLAGHLRHDGRVPRAAGLEEFRHAGQAPGDVVRLGRRTGRLGD